MTKIGPNKKRWSWPRDVALPVGQAAMESLVVHSAVLIVMASAPQSTDIHPLWIFGLPASVAVMARASSLLPFSAVMNRLSVLPVSLLFIIAWLHLVLAGGEPWSSTADFLAVTLPGGVHVSAAKPPSVAAWTLALYLAARGMLIGTQVQTAQYVARWFLVGLGVLVALFAVVAGFAVANLPIAHIRNLTVLYFILGLGATAFAHVQTVQSGTGGREQASVPWLIAVAVPIALIVGIGLAFGGGASQLTRVAITLLTQSLAWLTAILWVAIQWTWHWVLVFYGWISSWLSAESGSDVTVQAPRPGIVEETPAKVPVGLSDLYVPPVDAIPILAALLAVISAAFFLRFLLRSRARAAPALVDEESVSIWSLALFKRQMSDLLRSSVSRIRFGWFGGVSGQMASGVRFERPAVFSDMRAVYRAMLLWARERGKPRASSTTPMEFAHELASAVPESGGCVTMLTRKYARARYGAEQLVGVELTEAVALLDELISIPAASPEQPEQRFSRHTADRKAAAISFLRDSVRTRS